MLTARLKQLNLPEPVAIVGAGATGLSCFKLLKAADIDCHVFAEDISTDHFTAQQAPMTLKSFSSDSFKTYRTLLLSPGIDKRRLCFTEQQNNLITDIELFARLNDKPVIGVTGTNGKSTVVSLLHAATQAAHRRFNLCGNIGLPVLEALQTADAQTEGYIIELSSYQLEQAPTLNPIIGIWLNVSPDHLDRYDNYAHYIDTKANLFRQSQHIIANADDEKVYCYAKAHPNALTFSKTTDTADWYADQQSIYHHGSAILALSDFPLIGHHHADNIMAVFAAAEILHIDNTAVVRACKTFKALDNRMAVVGEKNGIIFINDSKGTNVGATQAAITGIDKPIVLIAGGQGKGQDFDQLAVTCKSSVKAAVLIGQDAAIIAKVLSDSTRCQQAATLKEAVAKAIELASAGEVVLLSPACASFDMFANYLARGQAFEKLVREWIDE